MRGAKRRVLNGPATEANARADIRVGAAPIGACAVISEPPSIYGLLMSRLLGGNLLGIHWWKNISILRLIAPALVFGLGQHRRNSRQLVDRPRRSPQLPSAGLLVCDQTKNPGPQETDLLHWKAPRWLSANMPSSIPDTRRCISPRRSRKRGMITERVVPSGPRDQRC